MSFIDEVKIKVIAGDGGNGVISFRREKNIPRGGPNGGDGGDGGDVYLIGDQGLNTLADFRHIRTYAAEQGTKGSGQGMTGPGGEDLLVPVPIGTLIYDEDTDEQLGDIIKDGQRIKVAQGGWHGLGNLRFKSSTNQAPRKCTPGTEGERRQLRLELKVLADVGLLGMPNAGKSTFIRAISAARPKVASYPFTTLAPNLGVVRVGNYQSFVVADIPGLIEGAADGAGLGIRFLKHLSRTQLLLHIVDIAPFGQSDPTDDAKKILIELEKYSEDLAAKERWLVINKTDLLSAEELAVKVKELTDALAWKGPVYTMSALSKTGTQAITHAIMKYMEDEND